MRLFFLLLLGLVAACTPSKPTAQKPLSQVIAEHQDEWLKIAGVVGCGETETIDSTNHHVPAVMIMVSTLTAELKSRLPSTVDGYPVVIEEVGDVRPLGK